MEKLNKFIDNINIEKLSEFELPCEIVVSYSIFEEVKDFLIDGMHRGFKIVTI
jgi:hypothetical protein